VVPVTALVLGLTVTALVLVAAGPDPRRRAERRPAASAASLALRAEQLVDRALPSRRRRRRDGQLPDALDRLGASLRAGTAIGPALIELAPHVPDPLGVELQSVARSIERGGSVVGALAGWSASAGASRDVGLVAAALTVGAGTGGAVARAVDGIAATLRERHELAAEVHALATQARTSAALLVTAPVAFTLLVATVEPGVLTFLLTSPVGLACLALGIALDGAGAAWMARITRAAA
jgi:tight adherence protein B